MKRKIKTLDEAKAAVAAHNKKAHALRTQEKALANELEELGNEILNLVDELSNTYVEDGDDD